jgi:hypothetical protein
MLGRGVADTLPTVHYRRTAGNDLEEIKLLGTVQEAGTHGYTATKALCKVIGQVTVFMAVS